MTTPNAIAQLTVNGGAATPGFLGSVAGGSVIAFGASSISGWESARWELRWPRGWATPAGWTLDGTTGLIYSTAFVPTSITLPLSQVTWGKWIGKLTVNGGTKGGVAGHPDMVDSTWGWEVLSPQFGLRELAVGEEGQADAIRRWADSIQKSLHALDAGKVTATTNATITLHDTIAIPDNSNVALEVYVTAKKPATATKAFYAYRQLVYRNGGNATLWGTSPTDLGTNADGNAWTVTFVVNGGSVEVWVTGQAATSIKWTSTGIKSQTVTDS